MIKMQDIVRIERISKEQFKISWKMTEGCNYHCSYCYMKDLVAKGNHTPQETVESYATHIDRILEAAHTRCQLHLIGGEVCLYDLIAVLEKIHDPNHYLRHLICATNFSQTRDYWQSLISYCNGRDIETSIIASFHITQCDTNEFINKAIALKDNLFVKCVINKDNIAEYKKLFVPLIENGVLIQPTIERDSINTPIALSDEDKAYCDYLHDCYRNKTYDKAHWKDIKDKQLYYDVTLKSGEVIHYSSNIEMINDIEGGLDTEGFYCTAGLSGIRINPKGELQRAGCRFCASKFGAGKLGRIEDFVALPKESVLCHTTLPEEAVDENGKKTGKPDYSRTKKKLCTAFINATMWRS